ncbi:Vancomycin resistance protein YoaR, contains peptidoglycan-binding and VanW domains [Amycolatopsis pretoriensis]|uniref:Vancomycin resistance protein YoaR, contains peptidoglycan-binding and VanW domains n=1 Tax=Amycolatopsis pretoriensis TaxID=218821 RepID=A0A1H5QSY0_9PSEU|nr:VanW family protein [Amycolatopsis pretoriensis]SEF28421.1 Vancomycin resistance protein YoaR, contains peptidoglycan-binding and VanW domains [Amycolatopsis pretoriensis]
MADDNERERAEPGGSAVAEPGAEEPAEVAPEVVDAGEPEPPGTEPAESAESLAAGSAAESPAVAWPAEPSTAEPTAPATAVLAPAADEAAVTTDLFSDDLLGELLETPAPPPAPETPARKLRKGVARTMMSIGIALGLFVILYAIDLLVSAGDVPRGVTVAGIDVGGLTHAEAEAKLRKELEPRLTKPVVIHAGDVQAQLVPARSGLGLDWPNTLGLAGHQPLSPITRIMSFFSSREVGVATRTDPNQISQAVRALADGKLNHPATEGAVGFVAVEGNDGGVTPYPILPRQGQQLTDLDGAVHTVTDHWLDPGGVKLGMAIQPVKATAAGVQAAYQQIVVPAVAKPVVVHGQGKDVPLRPATIASSFQFAAVEGGAVEVRIDQGKLQAALKDPLASTETDGKDAQIVFTGDQPAVEPSEDARKVNWEKTFLPLIDVLKKTDGRDLPVVYSASSPSVNTEAAGALGIKEVIGEFTTGGLAGPAATNNRTLAARVSGTIVKPGETFSLGARSGPRTADAGYVPAPADEDGTGAEVVGGGVSQLASTLYNAGYLAGLTDGGHLEHDHYLDRYPAGRDAKAVNADGSAVELKLTNDSPTGIAVQATVSGDSVTVRIWGTRHYRVESQTSAQIPGDSPPVQFGGTEPCLPSIGTPGFSVTDTRVLYDLTNGAEVRRTSHTATYGPRPTILC